MGMIGSEALNSANDTNAPLEQRVEANRFRAADVAMLASEFSTLLTKIDQQELSADRSVQLSALLGTFDELVRDMQAASADIRRLLAD
jgi:GH18 family chitinase